METAKLLKQIKADNKKLFIQFGGQGSPYLKEITKLYKEEPLLKEFFNTAFEVIAKIESLKKGDFLIDQGIDLKTWMENPDNPPSDDYLCRGSVSVLMIFLTQVAHYHLAVLKGLHIPDLKGSLAGFTGHSQGIISAAMAGLLKDGKDFYKTLYDFSLFIFHLGYRAQEKYPKFVVEQSIIDANLANGDKNPAPMVAVIGYNKQELEDRIDSANKDLGLTGADKLYISLYNTPDSMIISAKPESLLKFRTHFKSEMDAKKVKFVYLKTTSPFHCPLMEGSWEKFQADLKTVSPFPYSAKDLQVPVYSIYDGKDLRTVPDLAEVLFKEVVIMALHWDKAVGVLFMDSQISHVIDCGPSVVSGRLTGGQLTAKGVTTPVYCLANPKDLKNIFD